MNLRVVILQAVLLLLVLAPCAHAYDSAGQLHADCVEAQRQIENANLSPDEIDAAGRCRHYLQGFRDMHRLYSLEQDRGSIWCAPINLTVDEMVPSIITFMKEHPEKRALTPGHMAFQALAKAFPCPEADKLDLGTMDGLDYSRYQPADGCELGERWADAELAVLRIYARRPDANGEECGVNEETATPGEDELCPPLRDLLRIYDDDIPDWVDFQREPMPCDIAYECCMMERMIAALPDARGMERFHILDRLAGYCERGEYFMNIVRDECAPFVEEACWSVLGSDADPFLRHYALEILAEGFAQAESRERLERLAGATPPVDQTCPRILPQIMEDGSPEEIAARFADRPCSSEAELAKEALDRLEESASQE